MSSSRYYIELNILSSILSTHMETEEKYFNELLVKEEWFSTQFHKTIARAISFCKSNSMPVYEEFISEQLIKYNKMEWELWFKILTANSFSQYLFEQYLTNLKNIDRSQVYSI